MGFLRPVGTQYAITRMFGEAGRFYPFHIDPQTGLWVRVQRCSGCKHISPCGCLNPCACGNHRGVDFGCPESTEVKAVAGGMILRVGMDENQMHDEGFRIVQLISLIGFDSFTVDYRHISSAVVNVGDRVKPGDRIAYSGYDGPGAPYLHVEMRDIKGQFRPMEFTDGGAELLQTGRR